MQNKIFFPFAIVLFFIFRMMFKRAVFYHAGRKEWITDKRWYHYVMYYALMAFFTGGLLIPFFPEMFMQIGRLYDLHHGRIFVSVSSENDKELYELNTGLPDKEEIFKYAGKATRVEAITTEEFGAKAPRPAYSILENYMFKLTTDYKFADWHDALSVYMKELV